MMQPYSVAHRLLGWLLVDFSFAEFGVSLECEGWESVSILAIAFDELLQQRQPLRFVSRVGALKASDSS
jgi:hypothetical protein